MTSPDEAPFEDAPPQIVAAMGGAVPTVQQWRAISGPLEPRAVIAGAGSGKTAVMAARVVYLVLAHEGVIEAEHGGALPSEILCLTFTNKAAEELTRRVRTATEGLGLPEGEEATVFTYHAFAARLLDDYGLRMGLETGQRLLTEAQKWQLAESLLAERELEHLEVRWMPSIIGDVLALADECSNHLADPREVAEYSRKLAETIDASTRENKSIRTVSRKRAEVAELVAEYEDRKRELGMIDYGDQIALAERLVREHPEVVAEFRERFRVILLDEYQDTNVAQAELLKALAGEGYPIFGVGDPDQNIYAWRGATLRNVLGFHGDFGATVDEPYPLYVNFRSGSRILDAANAVIEPVPEERRAKGKVLRHHPPLGDGRVLAFVATDERAEAHRIADVLLEEAERGRAWSDVAVLCRKKRLFTPIAEVLGERGIPVEVVDLGGLLELPEVVDVVAWLRLLENPGHNVAFARIAQGPRWRIGFRDLAILARWSAARNYELAAGLQEDRSPGEVRFALVEALDHLGDPGLEELSAAARERLEELRAELAALREALRQPLGDVVAEVLERSGTLRELETSRSERAEGARRNLLNLVDHVASFAPVEGEASLTTLMAYLDSAEEAADELEPIQVSSANTVKLMTVHKAKGLEWPVVFVPGLAEHERVGSGIFPDVSRQANPILGRSVLPFEFRRDMENLPLYEDDIDAYKVALRERGMEEERRLAYVALTRAQELLVVSAAYWYTGPQVAHHPGTFFEEVAAIAGCEVLERAELPEQSPLLALREARAGDWPGPGKADDVDALFPEGWHAAALAAVEGGAGPEDRLTGADRRVFLERLAGHRERAELIRERTRPDRTVATPSALSVSSVIDYERCPKLFYWSQVRPLPRRPSSGARLGSEVHRWIETQSRGQMPLLDLDELPDLSTEERLGEPGRASVLREAFRGSRFARSTPLYTERPFLLYLDAAVVRGRIDAVFGEPDGPWEIVDYKTGRVPADDPLSGLQLDLYALACVEIWGKRPEDLTLTYFYLAENEEVTRPAGDPEATRARLAEVFGAIAEGRFDPTPGEQCRSCDFLSFCEAGRAFLG